MKKLISAIYIAILGLPVILGMHPTRLIAADDQSKNITSSNTPLYLEHSQNIFSKGNMLLSWHESHYSHQSHYSHESHYSHYSS